MDNKNTRPTLTYFSSRGKSELIRIMLSDCGVEYDEINVGVWHPTDKSNDFKELVESETLAFDSLPSYRDGEIFLVQSASIVRYLGKKFGLAGQNIVEESLVDQFYEGVLDLNILLRSAFTAMYPVVSEITTEGIEQKIQVNLKEKLPKFLAFFERALKGKTYLVGERISYADIALFYALDTYCEVLGKYFIENVLEKDEFENLKQLYERVKSREGIQKHLNNPNRFPKQVLPGYDKAAEKLLQ